MYILSLGGGQTPGDAPHPYLHLKRFSAPATSASRRQPRPALSRSSQSWISTSSPSEPRGMLQSSIPARPAAACLGTHRDKPSAGDGHQAAARQWMLPWLGMDSTSTTAPGLRHLPAGAQGGFGLSREVLGSTTGSGHQQPARNDTSPNSTLRGQEL